MGGGPAGGGSAGRRDPASSRPGTAPASAPCWPVWTAIIDVIVPRGGKSLVARVQSEARVPVFAHLEGICHVYVHAAADLEMAQSIVLNAKMRRTGVCGAAETLLVDRACARHAPGAADRDACSRPAARCAATRRRRRSIRA